MLLRKFSRKEVMLLNTGHHLYNVWLRLLDGTDIFTSGIKANTPEQAIERGALRSRISSYDKQGSSAEKIG